MSDDSISKALGIDPPEPQSNLALQIVDPNKNNDYEFARANLFQLAQSGMFALEDLLMIAKAAESARAFEVVSTMMKTLVETNLAIMDLAKKRKDIEGKGAHTGEGSVTNTTNQVFIGSTAELQAMMKKHGINARGLHIPKDDIIDGEVIEVKPDDSNE